MGIQVNKYCSSRVPFEVPAAEHAHAGNRRESSAGGILVRARNRVENTWRGVFMELLLSVLLLENIQQECGPIYTL